MTSKRLATVLKYIEAANILDIETIMSLRAPACISEFHPSSLSPSPVIRDNAAYAAGLAPFKTIILGFPVTIKQILEDEKQNSIMIWAEGATEWIPAVMDDEVEVEEWRFVREFIFIMGMDESGEKIEKVVEFVDSKATERLRTLIVRAFENRKLRNEKMEQKVEETVEEKAEKIADENLNQKKDLTV